MSLEKNQNQTSAILSVLLIKKKVGVVGFVAPVFCSPSDSKRLYLGGSEQGGTVVPLVVYTQRSMPDQSEHAKNCCGKQRTMEKNKVIWEIIAIEK